MMPNARWMNEEHIMLADAAKRFFAAELTPNMEKWRESGIVDRDFWLTAGDAGLLGASIPETYGGAGGNLAHDSVICLEHARTADSGWGWGVHNICTHYIVNYGSEEQKRRWLPKLATGEIVPSIAMSEPGTGSDLQAIQTQAKRDGDEYVINGSKTFITNGQTSDIVIVVTKTDANAGSRGVSLIVVETADAPGFRRGRNLDKLGMKAQDTSELFFEDVRVPITNLLGPEEGAGFTQLMVQLPWERLIIAIMAIGFSEVILDETLEYVKERKAFGQRIMDFQNTRFKLAECKTKLEVTRSFVNECIEKVIANELDAATASMAKWWSAQIQCEIADECLQLHGGYGYMMEYPIARYFADSRAQQIYGGTREIMKELIARSLDD
ncbi:MAG: acyl-CoA dehydrogenase family protein [Gammaproteobacteria bacterium]